MKKDSASNKWSLAAGAVLVGALFLTRGGLASLVPLLRLALPVIIVVVAFRVAKGRFQSITEKVVKDIAQQQRGGAPSGGDAGNVIDLCPKCGAYMKRGHKC